MEGRRKLYHVEANFFGRGCVNLLLLRLQLLEAFEYTFSKLASCGIASSREDGIRRVWRTSTMAWSVMCLHRKLNLSIVKELPRLSWSDHAKFVQGNDMRWLHKSFPIAFGLL